MKKRLPVIAGMLTSLAGLALLVLWLLPARPAVTKANFDRIEIGMTLREVEAILGAEKGSRSIEAPPVGRDPEAWGGDDGIAWIIFDEHKRVASKDWDDRPLPFFDRLRRQLPWFPF